MKFNANPDLFIGSQELNRLIDFLDQDGFRKLLLQDSIDFGIVNNSQAGVFDNFRVSAGTGVGTVKIADGLAIDNTGQLITYQATDNIALTDDSAWYWVVITHAYDTREQGLVSVDGSGNLSAPSGGLLAVLRGLPNNPVRITLAGSVLNVQEYEVNEVVDDSHAILAGDFQVESNLRVAVVGAFSPNSVPPSDSKYPYQYDSCTLTFVLETVTDTPPALTAGVQFTIARVKRTGAAVFIQDKRLDVYRSKADHDLSTISTKLLTTPNPVIGVTKVKFNDNNTPRDENLVYVQWSFNSDNWTFDSATNKVTLNGGQGGRFKDTTYFTNGDFDGWRLYGHGGNNTGQLYGIIRQSTKTGSQINLIIDQLDPDNLSDSAQVLNVTPDCDFIDIHFRAANDAANGVVIKKLTFPINVAPVSNGESGGTLSEVVVPLVVYQDGAQYIGWYQYDNRRQYGIEQVFPADAAGYYPESSFSAVGHYVSGARVPYTTNPTVTLHLASNAYSTRIGSLETGNLFGVTTRELDNLSPVVDLEVGVATQEQIIHTIGVGSGGLGNPYVFSVDHVINLKKAGVTALKAGSTFILWFRATYTPGGFALKINQDYVNVGSPGTNIFNFTALEYNEASFSGLTIKCIYDGTNWNCDIFCSVLKLNSDWVTELLANTDVTNNGGVTTATSIGAAASVSHRITDKETFIDLQIYDAAFAAGPGQSIHVKVPASVRSILNKQMRPSGHSTGYVGVVFSGADGYIACYVLYDGTDTLVFNAEGSLSLTGTLFNLTFQITARYIS